MDLGFGACRLFFPVLVAMRLIIISPPEDIPAETEAVRRVLQRSSATVHLRKPGQTDRLLADYLKRIPAALHQRIVVHGHQRLLAQFNLKGIHFSEKERLRNPQDIRLLRQARPECSLSAAFHRITDIPEHDGLFDYILLSPIFDSISKPGYRAAFNLRELKNFLSTTGHTVVALGGIDSQRAAMAAALGFKGLAVLGAVWGTPSPQQAAGQLSAVCRGLELQPVQETPAP